MMHIINPLPRSDSQEQAQGIWLVPGRNDDSGFRWGPFNILGPRPWPLRIQQQGGSVYYPYRDTHRQKHSHGPRAVDPTLPIIMKGNFFEDFTHIRDFALSEVYYWDNCLLPQLMYTNPANPRGSKVWCRLVQGSTAPGGYTGSDQQYQEHQLRVNDWLQRESQGQVRDWREICRVYRPVRSRAPRVLLCLSQFQTLQHYYGESRSDIEQAVREICYQRNWQLVIRDKRDRRHREQHSLTDQLLSEDYHCAICTHSAAALEILATGTPVVSLGAEVAHHLSTTWSEFRDGAVREASKEEVEAQMLKTLSTVFHKQELLSGSWSQVNITTCYDPYDQWRLIKDTQ